MASSSYGWNPGANAGSGSSGNAGKSWSYYDPSKTYGAANGSSYATAPVINGPNGYLENTPRAVWTRYLGDLGYTAGKQNSEFNSFLQNEYTNAQRGYEAALATNPNLLFQEYTKGLGSYGDWYQRFAAQSPAARGENWGLYAPRVRYIGR